MQRSTHLASSRLVSHLQSLEISVDVISDAMSKDDSVQDENDEQEDEHEKEDDEGEQEWKKEDDNDVMRMMRMTMTMTLPVADVLCNKWKESCLETITRCAFR